MRIQILCMCLFFAMLAPVVAGEAPPASQLSSRIGVIDTERALREYEAHQATVRELEAEITDAALQRIRDERDRENQKIEQLKWLKPGTPEYRELEEFLIIECRMIGECHPTSGINVKRQLREMVTAQQRDALMKIQELVSEYANECEFVVVVNSTVGLEIDGLPDITDEIIARLNAPRRR